MKGLKKQSTGIEEVEIKMNRFVEYGQIPLEIAASHNANWKVDGNSAWKELVDPNWAKIVHMAAINEDGKISYDKINIVGCGSYVLPMRITPKDRAEFLLIRELRPLLRDQNGNYGNVFIENIISGASKPGETPEMVAKREVLEETGYQPTKILELGSIYFDPSNSETVYPFFLAEIPFGARQIKAEGDEDEIIEKHIWGTLSQLKSRNIRDGKTLIALSLAEKVVRLELL